ncbi:MAG: hypothetical protein IJ640_00775 [Prevotella sp.]|nr:hypothetical protein [Prevotella sp.]
MELREIQLYDGMRAQVPVGTILVNAYFGGVRNTMRCFVPRGNTYSPKSDAQRYIKELRLLGVSVFLETEEVQQKPKYEGIKPDGDVIPVELTDAADNMDSAYTDTPF